MNYIRTYTKRAAVMLLMLAALLLPICAAIPDASEDFFVNDMAEVIDADTEAYIIETAGELYTETGTQVVVATVNFTDGIEIENYALQMFNEWGIGSSDRKNGLLILLVIGEENYWVTPGTGFEELFSGGRLKLILDEYMEPDFAIADYDAGVRKTFDAVLEELELYYSREDAPKSENDPLYFEGEQTGSIVFSAGAIVKAVVTIALVVLFIFLIIKIFGGDDSDHDDHDDHSSGGGGGGGGKRIRIHPPISGSFGRGFMGGLGGGIGREIGRSIGREIGRGFRGGSGGHRGGFGGFGGGSRGGFGGGSRGGFRGGGGSSRGGGAGRR